LELTKPNFSVAVIGKNECKTLPRLLVSLKEFMARGGEFVYYDTGSTDGTPDIARSLGCKVIEVGDKHLITIDEATAKAVNDAFIVEDDEPIIKAGDKIFDYSSARNAAASHCSCDWVWQPDNDEVFTVFNIDRIEESISEPGVDILEYEFVFSHGPNGEPIVAFRHSKMYDRRVYTWRGLVHECLFPIDRII
jgi:glycosyltransferase involved in cell wall biosynthesis